jgi:hypothetical protein
MAICGCSEPNAGTLPCRRSRVRVPSSAPHESPGNPGLSSFSGSAPRVADAARVPIAGTNQVIDEVRGASECTDRARTGTLLQVDARALRILFDTHWSSQGWKAERSTSPEDLAYAVHAGVMFPEPLRTSHDDLGARTRRLASTVDGKCVAQAFLSSLSTRRLDLRSALGSYAVARLLPDHTFTRKGHLCAVCGYPDGVSDVDLNVLSFERHKWGGVRRDDLSYIQFDLDAFSRTEDVE